MQALVLDAEWAPKAGYDLSEEERTRRRALDSSQVWRDPELQLTRRDRPTPADDEALVEVRYAGICGSDLSLVESDDDGYVHYPAYAGLPNVIGHEFSGEVVAVGSDVGGIGVGDLVTAEVTDYCGTCDTCRQGFPGHCSDFEQLGFTISGAFAEYVRVPGKLLWDVSPLLDVYDSEDVALRAAATVEPTTISYYGLFERAAGIKPGDYYVFHGLGPIGLAGMNLARAAGAGTVVGFEPSTERRAIAADLGFEHVYDPLEVDPVETVQRVTDGEGADVHVETAGAVDATYPVIAETLAEAANVVHVSNAGGPAPLDLRKLQGNAAQVYGTEGHSASRAYPRVVRLMETGRLDNRSLITSTYDLSRAEAAFERARTRVDGKVLVAL